MDNKLRLLGTVPLFSRLKPGDLEQVGRLADEIDVPAGRVLMRQGATAEEFFIIVDGTVAIDREGRPTRRLGPGDFLGEIALVDGGPRTATATAETPCRLLVVGHQAFHGLLLEFPAVQVAVLGALARRVRDLDAEAT
jgi:CRP-like cAMP-binding protein